MSPEPHAPQLRSLALPVHCTELAVPAGADAAARLRAHAAEFAHANGLGDGMAAAAAQVVSEAVVVLDGDTGGPGTSALLLQADIDEDTLDIVIVAAGRTARISGANLGLAVLGRIADDLAITELHDGGLEIAVRLFL